MCDESQCRVLGVEAILETRKANIRKAEAMDIAKAAADHRMADVQLVCQYAPEKVNDTGWNGRTALHWAVLKSSLETAQLLLASKAAVDVQNWDGETPIQWAQTRGNQQTPMEALLQQHQQ